MGRPADELQRDDNQLRCVGEPEELEGYPDTGLARKQAEKPVFRYAGRGRDIFRIQRRRDTYRENLRGESGGSAGIYGCVYGGREQNSVRAANG